jgi:PKD repeat protein
VSLCLAAVLSPPAFAQPVFPEVAVQVYRVLEVDPVDLPLTSPSFYYFVGIQDVAGWVWRGPMTLPDGSSVVANSTHTFSVRSPVVGIAIVLCDADTLNADDAADLGARAGGGPDDNGCPLSNAAPPDYAYQGSYDLITGNLTGDVVLPESGYLRASGDSDGSTGADENDANLWFRISDGYGPPVASAGSDRTVGAGEIVWFDGGASHASWDASLESYAWDLDGDGTDDAFTRVASTAYAGGTYTVRLRVTDSLGVTAEATVTVMAGNRRPETDYALSPTDPYTLQDVRFVDLSFDSDGAIVSRLWDFGDGTTSTAPDPIHQYVEAGAYGVSLRVTDDDGAVVERSEETLVVRNRAPTAAFSAVPDASDPALVRFREGAWDADGTVTDWRWDFGDGSTASGREPEHAYARPGTYVVRLQVRDDLGALSSGSASVVAQARGNAAWFLLPVVAAVLAILGFVWFWRRKRGTAVPNAGPPKALALLAAVLALLASAPPTQAYHEEPPLGSPLSTHQWIFDRAIGILAADGHPGLADSIDGAFLEEMKRGTIRADRTLIDSGDHYHDPWTHAGLPAFRDAADLSAEEFRFAVDAWSAGDPLGAAFHLGYAAHLVADVTVPQHARLTPLNFHAEYEAFVNDNKASAAVSDNGTYAFNGTLAGHYEDETDPWDWVDANAHVSYDWFPVASTGDPADFRAAMDVLLPIAQRTTAGYIWMFFRTVNAPPAVQIVGAMEAIVGVPFSLAAVVSEDVAVDAIAWTSDGGGGGTRREEAFEFSTPGAHVIRVDVTDVVGLAANATYTVTVGYPGGPRASVFGPTAVASGAAATFDGSGSAPGVVRYEWTVDGQEAGTAATLAVLLEGSRVALVELRVWDAQGRNGSARYPVAVEDRVPPAVDLPDRMAAHPFESVLLTASRYVSSDDLSRAVWSVDGRRQEGDNATLRFAEPGVYVVTLTVFDGAGNAATDSVAVIVEEAGVPLWAIAAVGVAVPGVALVAFVLWRRRRQT